MKEYRIRPLVALAVGTVAAVITMTSGCSSTPPSLRSAPYVPPMPVVEQVIPAKSAILDPAPEQSLKYKLEYLGAGRCKYNASKEAIAYFAKQKARIGQLVKEGNAATLHCLGRALKNLDDKSLAKIFFSVAFRVADNVADDIAKIYGSPLTDEAREELKEAQDIRLSAANSLGHIFYHEGNYEAAFSEFLFAARLGEPSAQHNLANLYLDRLGIETDLRRGFREWGRWFFRAAQQGYYPAQYELAKIRYRLAKALQNLATLPGSSDSSDSSEDKIRALKWAMLAQAGLNQKLEAESSTRQDEDMKKEIENFVKSLHGEMGDGEKSEANISKNEWGKKRLDSVGSGFYVNDGHILTNAHVVYENGKLCDYVSVMSPTDIFPRFVNKPDKIDASLDLALLHDPKHEERNVPDSGLKRAKLRNSDQGLDPGEYVIVTGFPLSHTLAQEMHTTTGVVVALSGTGRDYVNPIRINHHRFMISAPIQGGNSGGPVLDANGDVIGVVVGGIQGDGVENMNSAISLEQVRGFLDKNQVHYEEATLSSPIDNSGLAGAPVVDKSGRQVTPMVSKQAQGYTVLVECWMSAKE